MKQWLTEFFKRFGMESPSFFRVIQKLSIWCMIITGLPTLLVQFETENFKLPEWVHVFVVKAALISAAVAWIISKLPVKPNTTTLLDKERKLPFTSTKDTGNMVKMFMPILMISMLASCTITKPTSSETQQSAVTTAIQHTNDLYEDMLKSNDKSYTTYADRYNSILNEIDQIIARDQARPHAEKLYQQDLLIQTAWNNRISYHLKRGALTDGKIKSEQEYIMSLWDPRRISEYSLK